MKPSERPHYVSNKKFSQAVCEYCELVKKAKANKEEIPKITNYIGECFLKIAEGLSHKHNFVRYTYREEMVMDAVENCIKAIHNYDIDKATRTGLPNAFSYFTQISYFAFLRRIAKEKKQSDVKWKYIEKAGIEDFIQYNEFDENEAHVSEQAFVDMLKERIDKVKDTDQKIKEFKKQEKKNFEIDDDNPFAEFFKKTGNE